MTDHLEGYWQGEFTLRDGAEPEEPPPPPAIEQLPPPKITVRGRNLAVLLAPVYRAMTS
ncbi:hypothetical protein P3T36_003279 [Kitasatospora sp. MAP12-15]|uniref:hypothetical protein n=1 Tax=unclassified Kitasatospora TaxID=2633591 RepID=UPI002473B0D2|nr:hypothetical protein [Kitasatospora sp. MAP12-44]MDH6111255.1 hypothetical protein [Kitasatospora sp. MAP12-44]